MELHTARSDAAATIAIAGEMDAGTAYDVYTAAVAEATAGYAVVALDLSGVTFMDSVGLSMLVRARDELANDYESRLVLRNPSPQVARLLSLTALSAEFDVG